MGPASCPLGPAFCPVGPAPCPTCPAPRASLPVSMLPELGLRVGQHHVGAEPVADRARHLQVGQHLGWFSRVAPRPIPRLVRH